MKSGQKTATATLGGFLLCMFAAVGAQAGTILQPFGAATTMGNYPTYEPFRAINQSGLSAGYSSGVTDFDTYVATTSTVGGANGLNAWFASSGNVVGNFDFDLGGSHLIESFALWSDPQPISNQGIRQFNLFADDNSGFSSPELLGSFTAADANCVGCTPAQADAFNLAQVFGFTPTAASYVRLQILSNYGNTDTTGISEAAFEVAPVPLPAAAWLLLSGLGGIGALARRRKSRTVDECLPNSHAQIVRQAA
jgi:hypothetical protein